MRYIVAIDIGGTTFNSGIYSEPLHEIAISGKDKIRNYEGKEEVVKAIVNQVNTLIRKTKISKDDIIGLGVASPGPLDSKKGIILNTPNLKIFQNYKIASDLTKKLKINTFIENDANLFSLGEWYSHHRKNNVVMGVTLGTGLGLGLVINGKLFTGGNGFALEYGLSPFEWGRCEENVCIGFIRKKAKELYNEEISPVIIEKYYREGDKKAIKIYHEYGHNLGIVLSHIINMIDPNVISLGGGLSNAYDCYKDPMLKAIKLHSPSYSVNNTIITPSRMREKSTMVGASMMIKNIKE